MKNKIICLVIIVAGYLPCTCQENLTLSPDKGWWVNAGSAVLLPMPFVSFTYQTDHHLLSIRGFYFDESLLGGEIGNDIKRPFELYWDSGILWGIIKKRMYYSFSLLGGLSVFGGKSRDQYLKTKYTFLSTVNYYELKPILTVGVPLEMRAVFTPYKYIGIGLIGFADINIETSFAGCVLMIQFGNLR